MEIQFLERAALRPNTGGMVKQNREFGPGGAIFWNQKPRAAEGERPTLKRVKTKTGLASDLHRAELPRRNDLTGEWGAGGRAEPGWR